MFLDGDQNYFMRNPKLYEPGMRGACFGKLKMAEWVLYAIWHALVVYFVCFFALTAAGDDNSPRQTDGKDLGFWVAGHVVYGVCVFISNLVLAHKFHHHHWQGLALIGLMIFAFFFILGVQSAWPSVTFFADVSHIFRHTFKSPLVWLTIFMSCGQVSIFELLWRSYQFN